MVLNTISVTFQIWEDMECYQKEQKFSPYLFVSL